MKELPGGDGEVHLWLSPRSGQASIGSLLAVLEAYGLTWEQLQIETGAMGKPDIARGGPPLNFNLSHSGGYIAVAVSGASHPVGVDIECHRPRRFLPVARRCFSQSEVDWLGEFSGTELEKAFYQLWTLKEAWVKAEGIGLQRPLDSFVFKFGENDHICVESGDNEHDFDCWSLRLGGSLSIAVAVSGGAIDSNLAMFHGPGEHFGRPLRASFVGATRELQIAP